MNTGGASHRIVQTLLGGWHSLNGLGSRINEAATHSVQIDRMLEMSAMSPAHTNWGLATNDDDFVARALD